MKIKKSRPSAAVMNTSFLNKKAKRATPSWKMNLVKDEGDLLKNKMKWKGKAIVKARRSVMERSHF